MTTAMNGSANGTANVTVCDAFDPDQQAVLGSLRGITGVLCLVSTIIALLLFLCITPCKNFRRRIMLFLTLSTIGYLFFFIMQISAIWKDPIGKAGLKMLCQAIGFFIQYFGWQELLLVFSMTVYLYLYYVHNIDFFGPRRRGDEVSTLTTVGEIVLYVLLLVAPILPAGLGFIVDGYGGTRGWCWIRSLNSDCTPFLGGILLQVFLWYFWCFVCWVVTFGFLLKIVCTMRSNANQHSGKADRLERDYRKREAEGWLLMGYLLTFLAVNVIELIGAIISYAISDNLYVWWSIYAVLSPISAAAIPFAFVLAVCCCYREEIHPPHCCNNDVDVHFEELYTPPDTTSR